MPGRGQPNPGSWDLISALDIRRGEIVALVGAGGKTTTMFRLAAAVAGWRVCSTTTTHIGREQSALAPVHLVWNPDQTGPEGMAAALDAHRHVLVTGPLTENGRRWGSVPSTWIAEAMATYHLDLALVEADGAKEMSFKAPAAHEPVVPPSTTLLVPVMGISALNKPLGDAAHRPEQVTALTGLSLTEMLTAEAIAAVLAHPSGGRKGQPPGARVRVLVNQVSTPADLDGARQIARHLLGEASSGVEAVVIGAVATSRPVHEVRRPVAAVVLAAGRSLRMKGETPKQLLPWKGAPAVRHVVDACAELTGPLLVVTGHRADQVRQALKGTRAEMVHNPDYAAGEMLSSLQVGVRTLGNRPAACLVLLADQPWLEAHVVRTVLDAYAAGPSGLVAPEFGGRRGHPVLIDRRYWPELLRLEAGMAPRHLLERHPEEVLQVGVGTDAVLRDMDTWDQYQQALGAAQH